MAKKKKSDDKAVEADTEEHEDWDDDDEVQPLTREQVQHLRELLQERRKDVKERAERHLQDAMSDVDNLPDEIDIASRQQQQAYLLRLADKEQKLLKQIDYALSKFERGTYGVCEGTGEWIAFRRLELRPWTRYSREYKEQIEKEKGRRR